jgi:hypothetical protein
MNEKWKRLLAEAKAALKIARDLAEKADHDGREMTADEKASFDQQIKIAEEKKSAADAVKSDLDVLAKAKDMFKDIDMIADLDAQGEDPVREIMGKTLGAQVVNSPQFKQLLDGFRMGDGSVKIGEKSRVQSDPISIKSLVHYLTKSLFIGGDPSSAGAFVVPEQSGIVEMLGRRPLTLRDLVSVRRTGSDAVEYVRQTAHTNAAAPVAEATSSAAPTATADLDTGAVTFTPDPNGGYKPEGSWAFERDTTNVKTIAEWVPATKRSLADVAALEGLINDELMRDLAETEENQMLLGDGTGENLLGILSTSGIQTLAVTATSDATKFASLRHAKTLCRTVGRVNASAILVNPEQGEWIDVARDKNDRFYGGGPFGSSPSGIWGTRVVESEAIPAGTALMGDFSKAVLWDREQSTVSVTDSHADFFIRNLVAILAEERVAFAVTRPTAFVKITGFNA